MTSTPFVIISRAERGLVFPGCLVSCLLAELPKLTGSPGGAGGEECAESFWKSSEVVG